MKEDIISVSLLQIVWEDKGRGEVRGRLSPIQKGISVSEVKRWKKEQQKKLKCSITTYLSHVMDSTRHLIAAAINGRTDILCCWCSCFLSLALRWRSKFIFKWASMIKSAPRSLPAILPLRTLLSLGLSKSSVLWFWPWVSFSQQECTYSVLDDSFALRRSLHNT